VDATTLSELAAFLLRRSSQLMIWIVAISRTDEWT
jgi:hypothetical protein